VSPGAAPSSAPNSAPHHAAPGPESDLTPRTHPRHRRHPVPVACPMGGSMPGTDGHFRTSRHTGSPADEQATADQPTIFLATVHVTSVQVRASPGPKSYSAVPSGQAAAKRMILWPSPSTRAQREPVPGYTFKSDLQISAAGPDRAVVIIPVGLEGHRLVISCPALWPANDHLSCPVTGRRVPPWRGEPGRSWSGRGSSWCPDCLRTKRSPVQIRPPRSQNRRSPDVR
jgi:hypothetical protein